MDNILTVKELEKRMEKNQLIHRLRNWEDGDKIYGYSSFNLNSNYKNSMGKTDKPENKEYIVNDFERDFNNKNSDNILFEATVRNPKTESAVGSEPPLKKADLIDVKIIARKVYKDGVVLDEYTINK